ncbi:DMT family transporter [Salinisphaera hydrothermalis]|uniref:DMT family transporter n=1 Tax=Salinisphaera hydrothermalis TaxID=563188 RepID=UPI00333E616B
MDLFGFRISPAAGGLGCIVFAAIVLALGDGLVKIISDQVSVWQLVFLRSLIAVPMIALLAIFARSSGMLRLRRPGWVALRSVLLVGMWLMVYLALTRLTLPVVSAGLYTAPVLISLFVALRPGRALARMEVVGVALGFVGVLVLLRPGGSAFLPMMLLPVGGAVLYALAALITASHCRPESPLAMALAMHVLFLIVGSVGLIVVPMFSATSLSDPGLAFIATGWHAITVTSAVEIAPLLAGLAVIAVTASIAMARAYQMAPAPLVAAGDYSYLVFSGFWSLALFGQVPDMLALVGMALIALAGVVATRGDGASPQFASNNAPAAAPTLAVSPVTNSRGAKRPGRRLNRIGA